MGEEFLGVEQVFTKGYGDIGGSEVMQQGEDGVAEGGHVVRRVFSSAGG